MAEGRSHRKLAGRKTSPSTSDPESQPGFWERSATAEKAVLGAILEDCSLLTVATEIVSAKDFASSVCRELFTCFRQWREQGIDFEITVAASKLAALGRLEPLGGRSMLTSLLVNEAAVPNAAHIASLCHVIKQCSLQRTLAANFEGLTRDAQVTGVDLDLLVLKNRQLLDAYEAARVSHAIHEFAAIPDILTMDIPEPEYFVDGLIARGTLTEWTGLGGAMKSFMVQKLAVAVTQGTSFLGMKCRKANVLYLDYENPGFVVKARLRLMTNETRPLSGFKVWGKWLPQPAPQIGDPLLMRMVKEMQPLLLVIDPLRDAHGEDENQSTDMKPVLDVLRVYSSLGAAVLTLHHVARYDGSMSRGSTAIYDAMDIALLQQKDEKTGIVTLKVSKHRWAETRAMNFKVDFKTSDIEIVENPKAAQEAGELTRLCQIIQQTPGLSQNQVIKASGINRERAITLLVQNTDVLWTTQPGKRDSRCYYPYSARSQ